MLQSLEPIPLKQGLQILRLIEMRKRNIRHRFPQELTQRLSPGPQLILQALFFRDQIPNYGTVLAVPLLCSFLQPSGRRSLGLPESVPEARHSHFDDTPDPERVLEAHGKERRVKRGREQRFDAAIPRLDVSFDNHDFGIRVCFQEFCGEEDGGLVGDYSTMSKERVPLFFLERADAVEFRSEGFHPHVAIFGVCPDGGEMVGVRVAEDLVRPAHACFLIISFMGEKCWRSVRIKCSGPRMCKVQHFQGCSATTFVPIDVGVLVEPEGELAKSLYVAWAGHGRLSLMLVEISLWS
jgi:hypothetical protein